MRWRGELLTPARGGLLLGRLKLFLDWVMIVWSSDTREGTGFISLVIG
jgi:hypothetical protein